MMRWLPAASAAIVIAILLAIAGRDYPIVGHDYRYFVPRLIDTDLHLRVNGPGIQWYTPTFGSGLPAYPNPQHLEYSAIQALTYLLNPWLAILLTAAIAQAIGFASCYKLAREQLGLGVTASTLCATVFIANGFSISRLTVGHVGFLFFPLTALLLRLLLGHRHSALTRGAAAGLIVAATLY